MVRKRAVDPDKVLHGLTTTAGLKTSLSDEHDLVRASEINKTELRWHILMHHCVSLRQRFTAGQLGELHLELHHRESKRHKAKQETSYGRILPHSVVDVIAQGSQWCMFPSPPDHPNREYIEVVGVTWDDEKADWFVHVTTIHPQRKYVQGKSLRLWFFIANAVLDKNASGAQPPGSASATGEGSQNRQNGV